MPKSLCGKMNTMWHISKRKYWSTSSTFPPDKLLEFSFTLNHNKLATSYGVIKNGQHRCRWYRDAWRHQPITWINIKFLWHWIEADCIGNDLWYKFEITNWNCSCISLDPMGQFVCMLLKMWWVWKDLIPSDSIYLPPQIGPRYVRLMIWTTLNV